MDGTEKAPPKIMLLYGSPREKGNTDIALDELARGAEEAGAETEKVYFRRIRTAPCMECYQCAEDGSCSIDDDFMKLETKLMTADAVALGSPIFFYTVTAHTKLFMDRCQVYWARKYILKKGLPSVRPGVFIGVGATKGAKLFEGTLLTVKYFFDAIDVDLSDTLLIRGVEKKGEVLNHEEYMREARRLGAKMVEDVRAKSEK